MLGGERLRPGGASADVGRRARRLRVMARSGRARPATAAIWARNSATPSPLRAEVKNASGRRPDACASASSVAATRAPWSARLHLVALGQHDRVGNRRGVERASSSLRRCPSRRAGRRPARRRASATDGRADSRAPAPPQEADFCLGDGGVAVSRHVDEIEPAAEVEEVQLLRAPGRVRRARQRRAAGQRVDQRRLADVGAAGEGDFRRADRRQAVGLARRRRRIRRGRRTACARPRSPRPRRFARRSAHVVRCVWRNSFFKLPQSSTFTPALVMM